MFFIFRSSPHPFALAIMNDTLYWTEILTPYIHSCDKYDGSNVKMMYTGFGVTGMRGAVVIGPVQHTTGLSKRNVVRVHNRLTLELHFGCPGVKN